jgi:hypothetical protein
MGAEIVQTRSRRGFGRGTAVRDYWLQRCQGFKAVRPDGRPLGRVRRLETGPNGTVLRLTGFRARAVPVQAVDVVWPDTNVLLVGEPEIHDEPTATDSEADTLAVRRNVDEPRSGWQDETIPWWELVQNERPKRGLGLARRTTSRSREIAAFLQRLRQHGERAARTTLRVARQRWSVVRLAAARDFARGRLLLGRALLRLAVWVAGDHKRLE